MRHGYDNEREGQFRDLFPDGMGDRLTFQSREILGWTSNSFLLSYAQSANRVSAFSRAAFLLV